MSSKNDSKQEFKQKFMIVSVEDYQAKNAELARLREALSEAKRSLTRGIIIPKDIADSIDEALKSNDS